jgi:hypothetical protein
MDRPFTVSPVSLLFVSNIVDSSYAPILNVYCLIAGKGSMCRALEHDVVCNFNDQLRREANLFTVR